MAARLTLIGLQRQLEALTGVQPAGTGAWFTLFTTGPFFDGTGNVESGAARVNISSWSISGTWPTKVYTNSAPYVLTMPASTVTGWGISNASTGGDVIAFELFASPVVFISGDNYIVSSSNIAVTVTT
jgi:hypothetical protein